MAPPNACEGRWGARDRSLAAIELVAETKVGGLKLKTESVRALVPSLIIHFVELALHDRAPTPCVR